MTTSSSSSSTPFSPNFIILYVSSVTASAEFYTGLLGKAPLEASPGFAMFALDNGVMLGLWKKEGVMPAATPVGGSELGFSVADKAQVQARHAEWSGRGLVIAQPPTDMDFGHTFVALDPDGHRLRVFAPTPEAA